MLTRRPVSLAARLTIGFAAAAFLLVSVAGFIQYQSLKANLAREDNRELLERLNAALRARSQGRMARAEDREGPIVVRFLDWRCQPMRSSPIALPSPACGTPLAGERGIRLVESSDGHRWRAVTARLPDSAGAAGGWVEVLLNSSGDAGVLEAYRDELLLVMGGALLVAAVLGYGIARRGLRPLDVLADRISAIDARSLEQRLGNGDAPAAQPAEVRRLITTFDEMLARLERVFSALSEFSAELAHEFRTPIHILRQHAEIALQRSRTPDEYRDVLGASLEELDRMRRMVDDILFLARAEDPRAVVHPRRWRLAEEVDAVAEFLGADAGERGVSLASCIPASLEVVADQRLLRRALVNVLANALRHTAAGGRVDLTALETDAAVVIEVRDTGEGIDPTLLPHVFERHVRGPSVGHRHPSGAGLGLPIVRGIMSLHGGTADVSSAPGHGTRVTLAFPRRPPGASCAASEPSARATLQDCNAIVSQTSSGPR